VPGVIAQSILFTSIFAGIEIIWDKQFGFLKETLVAPVSRFSIVFGRTLGGATVATFQGVIVLVLAFILSFRISNYFSLILIIPIMLLIAILFTSIGTVIASIVDDMQGFQLLMNFLVLPLYFLSGSLFPLQGIPVALKVAASIDPLTYGVDGLRGVLLSTAHFPVSFDILILTALAFLLLVLGSYLFTKIQL